MTDVRLDIGQTLRQRRDERGLTVGEAAIRSRVPVRLVHALESNDYHLLPDAFYLIRLLRDYAVFLQLDPAPLESEFQHAVRHPPKMALAPPVAMRKAPALPWRQILWTAGAILVVVPLVFIALSLASKRASEQADQRAVAAAARAAAQAAVPAGQIADELEGKRLLAGAEAAPEAGSPPPAPAPAARPGPAPAPPPAAAAALPVGAAPPPSAPGSRRHVLVVRAREVAWLAVRADGGAPREVLLQGGQVARFSADSEFRITVGNAGGVVLLFDGVPVPVGGRTGHVIRDLVLPLPADGRLDTSGAGASARPAQP